MIVGLANLNRGRRGIALIVAACDGSVSSAIGNGGIADGDYEAARGGVGIVAGYRFEAVLVAIHRRGVLAVSVVGGLDLLVVDQFLALQHSADEEPDDDQHDCDFDQGESALALLLNGHSILLRICRRLNAVSRPPINGTKPDYLTSDPSQI